MTNQQIIEKAIHKAIDGGWSEPNGNTLRVMENGHLYIEMTDGIRAVGYQTNLERLIFNHDFAKALWGEQPAPLSHSFDGDPLWMTNLCGMVIADDPIKYLGDNI